MSSQTTRRTALAVPVTLPLLPVSAYASPNTSPVAHLPADPAIEAYEEWQKAYPLPADAVWPGEPGERVHRCP